jgi:hypothetical protein
MAQIGHAKVVFSSQKNSQLKPLSIDYLKNQYHKGL